MKGVTTTIVLVMTLALVASADVGDELSKLVASDPSADDYFGVSVAISGDTAIVGAFWDDDAGSMSGSAYLFEVATAPPLPGSVAAINADVLHDQGITGAGVKIGMVESDKDEPSGLPWIGHTAFMNGNLLNGKADAADASEHATEVAGIMVGVDSAANIPPDGKPYKGVAPNAQLAAAEATIWVSIDTAATDLTNDGCDVINISAGTDPDNILAPDINRTIDGLVDNDRVTIVAAAGNMSGEYDDEIASPAEAYNVIAVGALGALEHGGSRQTGPWDKTSAENIPGPTSGAYYPSGRCKPDIVAPGDCTVPRTLGDYADDGVGSSLAAPHVTGAVALMIQAARDDGAYFVDGDVVDPRIIKSALLTGADKSVTTLSGRAWTTIGPAQPLDYELGAGGLNVEEATEVMLGNDETAAGITRHMAFDTIIWAEQEVSLSLGYLNEGTDLVASLVWNAHYIPILGMDLSDLDLYVRLEESDYAWSRSSIDNVEHLFLQNLPGGNYSLVVTTVRL